VSYIEIPMSKMLSISKNQYNTNKVDPCQLRGCMTRNKWHRYT